MTLQAGDVQALSRLLEVGLSLPAGEREAWLAALPAPDCEHAPRLRRLLSQSPDAPALQRLQAPPSLGPLPWTGQAGERIGPYRLRDAVARGGMGEVWRAERADGAFDRIVALKLPRVRLGQGDDLAARLRVECQVLARLEHPHIARLYDGGVDAEGRPWIASEWVEGPPLDAWGAAQSPTARVAQLLKVVRAVAYAHARGVLHGDLKPAHVLVGGDGEPRLVDFGIGSLLDQPASDLPPALTPRYAAPERQQGGADSVQSDIYALGVMAAELLPALPGLRAADLAAIIARARHADPARRYAHASDLADDLAAWLRGDAVQARPLGPWPRAGRWLRRHWLGTLAAAAGSMAVVALGVGLWHAHEVQRLADRERLVRGFAAELFSLPAGASVGPAPTLLERGAGLIATRFAGDAELQADLYGAVGQAYEEMGAYRLSLEHRERRLAVLAGLPERAVSRLDRLDASMDLADVHLQLGDPQAALEHLQAARVEPAGSAAWRRAQLLAARASVDLGHFDEVARLQSALAAYVRADEPTLDAAWLRAVQAEVDLREGRLDAAFAGLEAGAELARRVEGPDSLEAASILLRGVYHTGIAERRALTERWVGEATRALRARGGHFRVRAIVEQARMWRALAITLRPVTRAEAVAGIQACIDELRAMGPAVPELVLADVEGRLGDVRFDFGDLDGAALIEAHYPLRVAAARRPMEALALHGVAAAAAAEVGRYDVALERSRARHAARVAAGRGDHPNVAVDLRQQALIHSMAGQPEAALAVLDRAPPAASMRVVTGLEPPWYANILAEARARVLLDAGRPEQALAVLPARAALPQDFVLVGLITAPDAVRGEALCALGRSAEGWPLLRAHVARLNPNHHPEAGQVARLKAAAAVCAQAAGDTVAGQRLAAEARRTFAAKPELANYFMTPLRVFDQKSPA